jgi:histidinol phosphatase-like PHP family hydrolase
MLERWQPKNRLVKVVEVQRTEQQSSHEDCRKALVESLERGKVYSTKDILASGIGFPENIVEETLDLLVQEGKAFEIPTSPKKWFYEG